MRAHKVKQANCQTEVFNVINIKLQFIKAENSAEVSLNWLSLMACNIKNLFV